MKPPEQLIAEMDLLAAQKPEVEMPSTLRQSFIRTFSRCPQSAYLYAKHDGGASSHAAHRGSAFHAFAERATNALIEQSENKLPPEIAKDLLAEVMADPQYVIPAKEADELRAMAYRWAEQTVIEPASIVGVEQKLLMEVAGQTVTGTIDLATANDNTLVLRDYKTSAHVPPVDSYGIEEDGIVRNARNAQLIIYACLAAFGETQDGLKIGGSYEWFHLTQVFPKYALEEGGLVERSVTIHRSELHDHRLWIEGLVQKVVAAFGTGDFPAVPGSHCGECSAPNDCPLSAAVRGANATDDPNPTEPPQSLSEAQEAATRWEFLTREARQLKANVKAYAKDNDCDVPFSQDSDQGLVWKVREDRKLDVEGLIAAALRSAELGEPLNVEDHYTTKTSTRYEKGKLNGNAQ